MADSSFNIKLPQEMIDDIIRAELVKALGSKEDLITAVVKSAMSQKVSQYDKQTLFQAEVEKMIRAAAQEVFQEWITENKQVIKAAFIAELNRDKEKRVPDMIDGLMRGMENSWRLDTRIVIKEMNE